MIIKKKFIWLFYPFYWIVRLSIKIYWAVWKHNMKRKMISCGNNVTIGNNCIFIPSNLSIGSDVTISERCSFVASKSKIKIGNKVMFGPNVSIRGGDHRIDSIGSYMYDVVEKLPKNDLDVIVEDDVWIGENVTILKGVTIGKGSVIGAASLLTKSVPPYTIHIDKRNVYEYSRFNQKDLDEHIRILNEKKIK
jgi:acetyltransferase-like isoleucine patch superfamily enzyme